MGKIGVSATKYLIKAKIEATGVVEKPDVIGAIFGQTEGLLGKELELRELQKGGRIGRIEVKVSSAEGKSTGIIEIPTSLSKEDTALIAAALETIERIGPSDSKITIEGIEDVRTAKRDYVVDRAKALLSALGQDAPGANQLSDQIKLETRVAELREYGPAKLAGGPNIEAEKDLILVEGRADVINLLKNNINNTLSVGGTNIHPSIKDLCAGKEITVFLDGDRGGDLILKSLMQFVKVEYVARAPMGMEVEELTQKDAIKALRNKITIEAAMRQQQPQEYEPARAPAHSERRGAEHDSRDRRSMGTRRGRSMDRDRPMRSRDSGMRERRTEIHEAVPHELLDANVEFKPDYKVMGKIAVSMAGTGNACLLKKSGANFREIGKVPKNELLGVLRNLQPGAAQALVVDSFVDQSLIALASSKGIKYILGHRRPYSLKRTPGVMVLSVVDIVEKTAAGAKKEGLLSKLIPPAPPAPSAEMKDADSNGDEASVY